MTKSSLKGISGLKPIDPKLLQEFLDGMEKVIPEIVKAVNEREQLAEDCRRKGIILR